MSTPLDVLIFGGGAAGLWSLDTLRREGWRALLLESDALGAGQTVQAQGIIHGGGKYALRGVRDFAAVEAIRGMPERWRRALRGEGHPDLSTAKTAAPECHLWLPRGSIVARIQSWGLMSVVAKAGLLATPPVRVHADQWPAALHGSALAVYSMAEPVVTTGTVLEALAAPHRPAIVRYDAKTLRFEADGVITVGSPALRLAPRAIVFAAGSGNGALLGAAGYAQHLMQERALAMTLLRGPLPRLFGHCVVGGKTRLTVTSVEAGDGRRVWQVGGELAERNVIEQDDAKARARAVQEIRRWLPGLDLGGVQIASYRAMRAEAATRDNRRPSGVHVGRASSRTWVAWPTKLALAPVLADELRTELSMELKHPAKYDAPERWPEGSRPAVAAYPWEKAEWFPVP